MTINDETFDREVIKNETLTIVDFWAPWCGPCRMLAPVLEDLAGRYEGKVKILKLNVDENSKKSQQYGVQSIPTLLFFKDGEVVDKLIGAVPKNQLEKRIERLLEVTA